MGESITFRKIFFRLFSFFFFFFAIFFLFFFFSLFFDVPLKMKVQHVMMILIGLLFIGSDAVGYYRPCSSQSDCDVGLVCRIPDEYMMKEKYCLLKRGVQCAFDTQRCGKTSPTGAKCCEGFECKKSFSDYYSCERAGSGRKRIRA